MKKHWANLVIILTLAVTHRVMAQDSDFFIEVSEGALTNEQTTRLASCLCDRSPVCPQDIIPSFSIAAQRPCATPGGGTT